MSDPVRFSSTMRLTGRNTGIEVPPELLEQLGGGKRPAVAVVVNGFAYRSTVGSMGGRALIPFSADKRAATGIQGNDPIEVELVLETAPPTIEVPDDLAAALDASGARAAFDALAPSHRKEHVRSVVDAKAEATRQRRIGAVVAKVSG